MSQLYKWGEGGKQTSKTKSEGEILVYESFVFLIHTNYMKRITRIRPHIRYY